MSKILSKRRLSAKLNQYLRIRDIVDIYNKHKQSDTPDTIIWRKHIKPIYHIEYSTFLGYLKLPSVNAKIKDLQNQITDYDTKNHPKNNPL